MTRAKTCECGQRAVTVYNRVDLCADCFRVSLDMDGDRNECENCQTGDMGDCPRCYSCTWNGCAHGELCYECADEVDADERTLYVKKGCDFFEHGGEYYNAEFCTCPDEGNDK